MVRDLRGVMEREKAAFGVLIVLEAPTKGMREEAAKAGVYSWGSRSYPRLQIFTVEELLAGKRPEFPAGSLNVSYERKEVRTARPKGGWSLCFSRLLATPTLRGKIGLRWDNCPRGSPGAKLWEGVWCGIRPS